MDHPKLILTARQIAILCLVAQDIPQKEIAATLNISHKTVNTHIAVIREKLKVKGIAGMTKVAVKYKLVPE